MKKIALLTVVVFCLLCFQAYPTEYQFVGYATKDTHPDFWQIFEFDITSMVDNSSNSVLSFYLREDPGSAASWTTSAVYFGIENETYYVHLDYWAGYDTSYWKDVALNIDGQQYVDQYYGLGIIGETSKMGNWGRINVFGDTNYDATTYVMSEFGSSPVPEPTSLVLIGVGTIIFFGMRKKWLAK